MELTPYVENLRRELTIAAEVGGDEARALADRLLSPLDAAVRLTLLEALSAAADEISLELAPGSVDVRLRGGAAGFRVTPPPPARRSRRTSRPRASPTSGCPPPPTRTTPRWCGSTSGCRPIIKARIEDAAAGGGLSVNAWIVRAAAAGLEAEDRSRDRRTRRAAIQPGVVGERYTGWAR